MSDHCLCSGQQTKLYLLVLFFCPENLTYSLVKVSSQGNVLVIYLWPAQIALTSRIPDSMAITMDHHKFEVHQITKGFSIL